jgi:hypothetical protein
MLKLRFESRIDAVRFLRMPANSVSTDEISLFVQPEKRIAQGIFAMPCA